MGLTRKQPAPLRAEHGRTRTAHPRRRGGRYDWQTTYPCKMTARHSRFVRLTVVMCGARRALGGAHSARHGGRSALHGRRQGPADRSETVFLSQSSLPLHVLGNDMLSEKTALSS
jgi:hypothetical protein